MARSYEYVIHGPPASSNIGTTIPRKSLFTRQDSQPRTSLRTLYRISTSPTEFVQDLESRQEHRVSSPTTPKPPLTPPAVEHEDEEQVQGAQDSYDSVGEHEAAKLRSTPVTPVNLAHSPPTPEDTPPRDHLEPPGRPFLTFRPSLASTRAESFQTARENIYTEDEFDHLSLAPPRSPTPLERSNDETHVLETPKYSEPDTEAHMDHVPNEHSTTLPSDVEKRLSSNTVTVGRRSPESQIHPEPHDQQGTKLAPETADIAHILEERPNIATVHASSVYRRVTMHMGDTPTRETSLRDRLKDRKSLGNSASTEAFANVIGWNDGGVHRNGESPIGTNRWSGHSNLSAVEAYVVESPMKPKKRGTLRKVVKNDSLRSTSSPIPASNRTSLQSISDSPHRLLHKKQKLNNENRWSITSDVSRRSMSWGSAPVWPKTEVIRVAVIPERSSPLDTSASGSRRHSRSISESSGHPLINVPPFTTPAPRRKRAFSGSAEHNHALNGHSDIHARNTSWSAPTSGSGSRVPSVTSQQFSMEREKAEKDLRSTLERMESERVLATLKRGSYHSASPTPASKQEGTVPASFLAQTESNAQVFRKPSSAADSMKSRQKSVTIEPNGITPGTKEWADLRPSNLTGTPFSQASMLSTSPEIIEAQVVNFFPHNNKSLQLIEPNRLSESQAVRALRKEELLRANTVPARAVNFATPRTNAHLPTVGTADSPLRNPRKPPEPPQVQFMFIPPTPQSELNHQLGATPDASPVKPQTGSGIGKRPNLQGRDRSESFIKSLTKTMSLRNAKNPKADQDLDGTLHPFWRPRAFWDDDDYRRRTAQEREQEIIAQHGLSVPTGTDADGVTVVMRSMAVQDPRYKLVRSNTITTGPMSLVRKMSEKRRQRRVVDEHIAGQQALVKQTSYSSLQKIQAGRRLYGLPPIRSLSLNVGIARLGSLKEKVANVRTRREDEKREIRREKLRRSIGTEVVSQGDSRFPRSDDVVIEHIGGYRVDSDDAMDDMLEHARAEELVGKRGLRM